MKNKLILLGTLLFIGFNSTAQTNPEPHILLYSNFEFMGFEDAGSADYPKSIQGWGGKVQTITPGSAVPTNSQAKKDQPINTECCIGYYNYNVEGIGMNLFQTDNQCLAIVLAVNTTGTQNDTLFYTGGLYGAQVGSLPGKVSLQYRAGSSGDWTNTDTTYAFGSTDATLKNFVFPIPSSLENLPVVQFRWMIYYTVPNSLFTDNLELDNIKVKSGKKGEIPAPIANFGFVSSDLYVTFSDSSLNFPDSYKWDFGDGQFSTKANTDHIYAAAGEYQVKLLVSNPAASDSIIKTITVKDSTTSIGFVNGLNKKLNFYPNPVQSSLILKDEKFENANVQVYDLMGREIMATKISSMNAVDVRRLKEGNYILRVSKNQKVYSTIFTKINY